MTTGTTLAPFFAIHNMLAAAAIDQFTPEQWAASNAPTTNHPTWIFAHLIGVRREIARNLGSEIAESNQPAAGFGDPLLEADQYSAPTAMQKEFTSLGEEIAQRIAVANDDILSKRYEPNFPDDRERTIGEATQFLIAHEGIHLGQLSLIRRLHGLPGIADGMLRALDNSQASP